ncbi:DPP IV N-terminal domain-containing protein [Planctomyces sp. SH-PL62]|uniref:DPP IV N-terminal domain-containing protein n=1 Tax=Planctomyces sp. SH-PL62 TaxID=1636152 RepID=UPI00078C1636|nr:DPP IV N-terminal domain-containing protein [Planctomyces sp. SH-PL62]AMV38957.1 Prolyl tripeptidyl peptidase precursor [Planctomyces sp. SH-PL62]
MLLSTVLLFGLLPAVPAQAPTSPPVEELATVAEKSGFKATARHEDVVALCRKLAEKSPNVVFSELGRSDEGRPLPLLIFADPPVKTPAQAAASGKLVVMAIGDIHGGEVCGKEGLLMLARELAVEPHPELLKNLIVVVAPLYNADGNERIAKDNRPGQVGPEEGMGVRGNARGLDLNRDFIKLEAPETLALVKFLNEWDPHIVLDTHTTNGSHHRYTITYDGPRNPSGDPSLIRYARTKLFPALTAAFKQTTGLDSYYYGSFGGGHDRWEGFPALGRFGTNYVGLRNRIGILSEAYAYAPYETRVLATRDFARECLKYASTNQDEIKKLLDDARKAAEVRSPAEPRRVALRSEPRPLADAEPILGYVEKEEDGRRAATDEPRDYRSKVMVDFEAVETAVRPFAYLLSADQAEAAALLQRHGIRVEELREDLDLEVEVSRIDEITRPESSGWDRQDVRELRVSPRTEPRRVLAGTLVVRDAQPLGALAAYLLEPRSEDGLATWRTFPGLRAGDDFPVLRLAAPAELLTTPARDYAEPKSGLPIRFDAAGRVVDGSFGGSAIGVEWLDDEHWLRGGRDGVLKVDALTGRAEPFVKSDQLLQALRLIPGLEEKAAEELSRRLASDVVAGDRPPSSRPRLDPTHKALLFEHEHDLYFVALDGSKGVRLTNAPGDETDAQFSPDGRRVSFVRDFDLHVVDVDAPTERALTTGGTDALRRGRADWVYFEEIFNRSWTAHWWSPDSQRIAFLEFDDAEVGTLTMLHDEESPRRVEVNRYPRAGEPNPRVRLGIVPAQGGPVQWADLSSYSAEAFLISGVSWRPDSRSAFAFVQDRVQTWLDLLEVPADGAAPHVLFRDRTKAWIADPSPPSFLDDGSFLWLSERDGWKHIYHYATDGSPKGRLTEGEWEVRSIQHVDRATGEVAFLGTRDAPMATQLYKVRPGGAVERITSGVGSYQTEHSPDGRRFVATWSDLSTPSRVKLHAADGSFVRTVDSNPVHKIQSYRFGPRERFQIPTRDGFLMEAELILPPDLDPNVKHPVWFTTYGGPHTPVVNDAWANGRVWDQALAAEGFIVFRVDPRPASGKGAASAWTAYRKLGVQELEDVKDAIAWLRRKPFVDGDRIGMTGHSFGGYLTAFAMTHSDLFACGIAGAPVTDWRDYDTIYTERLMGLPQDNPEGYKASSVVAAAKDLRGKLLLVHGSVDDNVSVRNTMRLVEALQEAGKDFELMIYPGSRHGIASGHYSRLMLDFIRRKLATPKAAAPCPDPIPASPPAQAATAGFVHP